MYKKLMLLLVAGLLMTQAAACGNKESTETNESAVELPTADSDIQLGLEDLPELPSATEPPVQEAEEEEYVYEPATLSCLLPKGFKPYEGEEGIYVYKSYPKDISTISYLISESGEDITQMTKDEYKAMREKEFLDSYGDEVTVNITSYEKVTVDKRPGLRIKLEYDFKDVTYEQLIYNIYNGDETHSLNFTEEKDYGWMPEFEESGKSLHFQAN